MKKLVAIATLVAMLLLVGCAQGQASTSADASSRSAASASASSSSAESTNAAVGQSATTATDDSTESAEAAGSFIISSLKCGSPTPTPRVPLQNTYKQGQSRWTCIHTAGSSRLARFRGPSRRATSRSQPRQETSCCTRATKSQSSRARTAGLILHSVISKAQLPIRCVKC